MTVPFDMPRQAAQPTRAANREECWSLLCVSCEVTVAAGSRVALADVVRDQHVQCVTAERVSVTYAVTTETMRGHPASRPHHMWLDLPALLLRHPTGGEHAARAVEAMTGTDGC